MLHEYGREHQVRADEPLRRARIQPIGPRRDEGVHVHDHEREQHEHPDEAKPRDGRAQHPTTCGAGIVVWRNAKLSIAIVKDRYDGQQADGDVHQ